MGLITQAALGDTGAKASSEVTGHSFNSVIRFNGITIAANASGLFKLNSGNTLNGTAFTRRIVFPSTDFNIDNPKRVRCLDIGFYATEEFTVKVAGDNEQEYSVEVTPNKTSSSLQRIRVPISRAVQGRYIKVTIESNNYLRLDSIHAVIVSRSLRLNTYNK